MSIKDKPYYKQPWYGSYRAMMDRCYNKKVDNYSRYGGRGIKVCDEWFDIESFAIWCESSNYEKGLTIDRIDPNGNYEPNNCRWTDSKTQLNNTKRNTKVTYKGGTHTLAEWAEIKGINYSTFCNRWVRGWSIEKMLEAPTRTYKVVI